MKPDPIEMAKRIQDIANDTLRGVQSTMDRECWPPRLREIIWEAIGQEAMRRARS